MDEERWGTAVKTSTGELKGITIMPEPSTTKWELLKERMWDVSPIRQKHPDDTIVWESSRTSVTLERLWVWLIIVRAWVKSGTQDDSDSECDETVIVVPSLPSNAFSAEKYGFGFSKDTEEHLRQADMVPAGGIDPAASISAGTAEPFPTVIEPVHVDETSLPPSHSLGSSEHSTRFPSPSDLANSISSSSEMEDIYHHPSTGIFTSSSYDADFGGTVTNLAPIVAVDPVPTKRVNTIILHISLHQFRTRGTLKCCHKLLNIDSDWVEAMQEEMQQFINQKVWKLIPLPNGKIAIGTKWILKNKRDARGIVVRNKSRLVAQGHRQEEGIDYDEVFAPVARIEAIRLFLTFTSYIGFMILISLSMFHKVGDKALVLFHQAPLGLMTLFLGLQRRPGVMNLEVLMKGEFEMSDMGELTFFLGLQVKRRPDGSLSAKTMSACSRHQHIVTVDYAGSSGDRKSTSNFGGCQFLGRRLISWQCKKQTIVATSSTEAEYVAAANCCGQNSYLARLSVSSSGEGDSNTVDLLVPMVNTSYCYWSSASLTGSFGVRPPGYAGPRLNMVSYTIIEDTEDHMPLFAAMTSCLLRMAGFSSSVVGKGDIQHRTSRTTTSQLKFSMWFEWKMEKIHWDGSVLTTPPLGHSISPKVVPWNQASDSTRLLFKDVAAAALDAHVMISPAAREDRLGEEAAKDYLKKSMLHLKDTKSRQLLMQHAKRQQEISFGSLDSSMMTILTEVMVDLIADRGNLLLDSSTTCVRMCCATIDPQPTIHESSSKSKSTEAPKPDVPADLQQPSMEVPSQKAPIEVVEVPSTTTFTAKPTVSTPKKVDPEAEHKMCLKYESDADSASDNDTPVNLHAVVDWELLPTGLGWINVIYRKDNSRKCFTSLREILHLVTRADLMTIYGRVMTFYQDTQAEGVGLVLWGDLKVLMDSPEANDGSDVWKNQNTWSIQSWKLYSYTGIHVLETVSGLVLHMFVDKKYPLSVNLIERMLDHQLEICRDTVGNELTTAVQLIAFLKKQISDSKHPKFHDWYFMKVAAFGVHAVNFLMLLQRLSPAIIRFMIQEVWSWFQDVAVQSSGIVTTSRYVVPTGRVKVPAGRYVVPTGKDNVIVSAGRSKVIPAGRTILVLEVIILISLASLRLDPTRLHYKTPNAMLLRKDDEAEKSYCCTYSSQSFKKPRVKHKRRQALPDSTGISEDTPEILAFRREFDELAPKNLSEVPKNKATSATSVNSGSGPVNTQHANQDDSYMIELIIFNKPQKGIFDEASYDARSHGS
ncbi:putative ribonuclease H-like domain-containing protein [Tanacetum coccineum]